LAEKILHQRHLPVATMEGCNWGYCDPAAPQPILPTLDPPCYITDTYIT